jgi:hypothetical protein
MANHAPTYWFASEGTQLLNKMYSLKPWWKYMIMLGAAGVEEDAIHNGKLGVLWHIDLYVAHWSISGMLMHNLA